MNKKQFYAAVILLLFLAAGIQPALAIDIPTDLSVGSWDENTRTYTLNQNVTIPSGENGLVITEGNLTLDGGPYSVTSTIPTIPNPNTNGILLSGITGVTVKNVTVSGFVKGIHLTNNSDGNTLMDNMTEYNQFGIYLDYSNHNTLSGNTVSNYIWNDLEGIGLHHGQHNMINGNTIQNNYNGIVLDGSGNNQVYQNNFLYNTQRQAYLMGGSNNNQIYDNDFNGENTWWQVEVGGGSNNKIYYNNFYGRSVSKNYTYQVHVTGGNGNQIYNNNFFKNGIYRQVYVTLGIVGNVFNLDLPTGGNYYSDKTGPDVEEPFGIVDSPYTFWEQGQDDFPWVLPNGWPTPPPPPTPEEAIVELIDYLVSLNLHHGIENSLDAKLDAALNALDDVNQNNDVAAINSLNAFINAVQAQSGKKIEPEDANALIADAQEIIDMLISG